jgi:PAS domain S-box-containing protein
MKFFKGTTLLFLAIIIFGGLFGYWLWGNYDTRSNELLTIEQQNVSNQYSSTVNSYRLVSKTLYDEVLNSEEILNWLAEAEKADPTEQAVFRQKLYKRLTPVFDRLKKKNFKQINFYLPDTTNFLNMQRPDYFGVKFGDIRPSVKMVSQKQEYVEGFEEGKDFNGFMFVFPLSKNGQYLGSVETSVSFNTFRNEMSLIFPLAYNFLIKKNVLSDMVYSDEARSYFLSDLNRDYFYEKEADSIKRVDIISSELISKINTKIKTSAYDLMTKGQMFTKTTTVDNMNFMVTFVPIKNIKGDQVAYMASYHLDDAIALLYNDLLLKMVFLVAIVFAMLFFIYYIHESQQKLLDTGEKLKNITTAMGEGLIVINPDEKVVFYNDAAAKISGFSTEKVLNQVYWQVLKFVHENDEERNDDFVKYVFHYNEPKNDSQNVYLKQADGDKVPLAISAAPLRSGGGKALGCIVVFRDITQEKEVDKAKTEFVSLASHQLKTPMSAVNWYSEMLMDEDVGKLTSQQKDFLKEIREGNDRMVKLVNGLLNVSRIDMGTLSIIPEPVDLKVMFESAISELQFGTTAKKIKIVKIFDPTVPKINLDVNLMRIVVQNLLSNAVKYSREGGEVRVEIKKQNAKDVFIAVKDSGYGIPKKQQPSIFKKLFRADNVKTLKVEGTGLGLYVAKSVVEAFGGKIWFESEENKGTSFYITLPLKGVKAKTGTKGLESNA